MLPFASSAPLPWVSSMCWRCGASCRQQGWLQGAARSLPHEATPLPTAPCTVVTPLCRHGAYARREHLAMQLQSQHSRAAHLIMKPEAKLLTCWGAILSERRMVVSPAYAQYNERLYAVHSVHQLHCCCPPATMTRAPRVASLTLRSLAFSATAAQQQHSQGHHTTAGASNTATVSSVSPCWDGSGLIIRAYDEVFPASCTAVRDPVVAVSGRHGSLQQYKHK